MDGSPHVAQDGEIVDRAASDDKQVPDTMPAVHPLTHSCSSRDARPDDNMVGTPGDTSGRNHYDGLFARLSNCPSVPYVDESVAAAYLDGKPPTVVQ